MASGSFGMKPEHITTDHTKVGKKWNLNYESIFFLLTGIKMPQIDSRTAKVLHSKFLEQTQSLKLEISTRGVLLSILDSSIKKTNMHFNTDKQSISMSQEKISKNTMEERVCKKCGKTFMVYPYWRMANCEGCRKKTWRDIEKMASE